jgi:hypothetical protein
VATITLWAGIMAVAAGIVLGILAVLGFRHAANVDRVTVDRTRDGSYATSSV